jgi:hypothetical protein
MKKSNRIIECLNTGIFPAKVVLSVGFNYKEIISHLKKQKANEWAAAISEDETLINSSKYNAMHRVHKGANYFYIIITRTFDFSDWDMCMLAHEIVHMCQFILPEILNRDKEIEAEAYLHTHLMDQALKALRK